MARNKIWLAIGFLAVAAVAVVITLAVTSGGSSEPAKPAHSVEPAAKSSPAASPSPSWSMSTKPPTKMPTAIPSGASAAMSSAFDQLGDDQ